ncbi:hypothetical protein [Actinomyces lilanjuaniae]|uniref:hypothetical protein n=1 Tax=Actinomyces lilanjuaniae TaxID=2321394 RepID=UPI0013C4E8C8|nr:hypothetical protein [Actinomyces lilanjuaniae]
MSDTAWIALAVVLAVSTLAFWALAMFTDTRAGKLYAAFGAHTKNRLAFLLVGSISFIIGGTAILTEPLFPEAETFRFISCGITLILLVVGCIIDIFPIPLPRWMYPQWHAERRLERRRAALAAASSSTTSSANKDPQPPATIPAPPQQAGSAQEPPSRSPGEGQTP